MRRSTFSILLVLSLSALRLAAQSPYAGSAGRDVPLGAASAAAGITALLMQSSDRGFTPDDVSRLSRTDVNRFDRGMMSSYSAATLTASDIGLVAMLSAPAALLLSQDVRSDVLTVTGMYAETMVLAASLTTITKSLVLRTRPWAYDPDAPMDLRLDAESRLSFFSGHTAMSFASAVFLSTVHAEYFPDSRMRVWVWTASLAGAATVGALRIAGGAHFLSDVLVGAVFGSAVGWIVPAMHRTARGGDITAQLAAFPPAISLRIVF